MQTRLESVQLKMHVAIIRNKRNNSNKFGGRCLPIFPESQSCGDFFVHLQYIDLNISVWVYDRYPSV